MRTLELMLSVAFRLVPDALHAEVFARGFNHALRGQRLAERLGELEGRALALHVEDTDPRVGFRIVDGRLVTVSAAAADVWIRGKLADFFRLATRGEDPDTLFFQRRLSIEGDTETGLHVKNLLDALEYDLDAHLRAVLPPPLAAVATRLHHDLRSFLALRASNRHTPAPRRAARPALPRRAPNTRRPTPRGTAG